GRCSLVSVIPTPTPTPLVPMECNPLSAACPNGGQCLCCCGTWLCMPPYLPCCALPCPYPTPTPTLPSTGTCIGDCNGDGGVTVGEVIGLVGIALGTEDVTLCPDGIPPDDGSITIARIIQAVNNGLFQCGTIPTPTPEATPVLAHGHTCCE